MANRVTPGSVKILTQEGEVHVLITLELNINLNSDGIQTVVSKEKTEVKEKEKESDIWESPDFGSSPKINFGKTHE